jgi:hypothetical protein
VFFGVALALGFFSRPLVFLAFFVFLVLPWITFGFLYIFNYLLKTKGEKFGQKPELDQAAVAER